MCATLYRFKKIKNEAQTLVSRALPTHKGDKRINKQVSNPVRRPQGKCGGWCGGRPFPRALVDKQVFAMTTGGGEGRWRAAAVGAKAR